MIATLLPVRFLGRGSKRAVCMVRRPNEVPDRRPISEDLGLCLITPPALTRKNLA